LLWLRNRIAPHTHRDQAPGVLLEPGTLVATPPQKNVGTAPRPIHVLTERWLPVYWRQC